MVIAIFLMRNLDLRFSFGWLCPKRKSNHDLHPQGKHTWVWLLDFNLYDGLVMLLHLAGEREPDLQTIHAHKEGQTPSQLTGSLMVLLKFGRRKMLEASNWHTTYGNKHVELAPSLSHFHNLLSLYCQLFQISLWPGYFSYISFICEF